MPAPAPLTEQPKSEAAPKGEAAAPEKAVAEKTSAEAPPSTTEIAEKPSRPAWLGKSFDGYWSDDKGVDAERLEADFGSLRNIEAEVNARKAAIPKEATEYEVALPEKFDLPKELTFDALKDDPFVADAQAFALAKGWTKDEFKEVVGLYAKKQIADYTNLQAAAAKQRDLLGANANARVEAVVKGLPAALATVVPDAAKAQKMANSLLPMMFTAEQIETFENLIKAATKSGGPKLSAAGREVAQPDEISDADYKNMSLTQRIVRATKIAAQRKTS